MSGGSQSDDLVLFFPYPPTANNLFRSGDGNRRYKTAEYTAWKKQAGYRLNPQLAARTLPLPHPYAVLYEVRRPDKLRRDIENLAKPLSDQLVTSGVLLDDCFIEDIRLRWVFDVPWEVRATIRSVSP